MKTGVLLLHGFAGTRDELAPLKQTAESCGAIVSLPSLPGHELTQKDFAAAKYTEWIHTAVSEAEVLRKECDRLIVIGFSMGGMLSVNVCKSVQVDNLVLINTPVYYWDIKRIAKNILSDAKTFVKKYFSVSVSKPIPALVEFLKLLKKTNRMYGYISCPTLIIQTLDDDTVNAKSADYIHSNIGGESRLVKYPHGGHVMFYTDTAIAVCDEVKSLLLGGL